jgi:hypothetical protein
MMASLLVILSVVRVLLASLPDTGFDAIWSHLMVAQDIAQNRYLPDTDVWHTLVPHAVHMIFGLAVALGGTAAATLMNLVLGIVAVAGTVAFGARLYSRATGLAAAMFLVGTPLLLALGTTAYVDTGAVLYALALTMCVVEFADDSSMGWSALVGANLGMLTGIKDVGLMFAPVVAVVVVVAAVRGRKATKWVRPVALGVGVFAVTGLSWILRTWLITRNPVFPLMNSLFHSPYWGEGNLNFGTFGVPRTPVNTVLTPYWVTVSTHHFVEGADGCAGGLLLLIWPLWLVGPSTFGRRRWLLAALALAFLVEQWTLVQYLRYSLVVWPLLALLAAGGLVSVWENPRWRPAMRGSLAAAVALVCAVALLGWAARTYRRDGYAVLHPENPGAYLASHLSGYRAYYWTATHVPPDAKILADPGIAASAYAQHHLVPYWASTLTDAGVRLTRIGTAWYVNGVDAAALGDRHNIQYLLTTGNRAEELANRTVGPTSYTVQYTDGTLGLVRMEPRS